MPQKRYLFTPGPTPVPPEVLAALAEPVLHHRAPDFRVVYERVLGRLREVHRTSSDVLLFTCSGTGAFESAVVNLCSPGERVLVVSSGQFGERWAAMFSRYGCEVEELGYAWGETPSPDDLARRLSELEPCLDRRPRALGDVDGRRRRRAGVGRAGEGRGRARRSSMRCRASARCHSRPTSGASTSSSRARRRR